MTSRATHTHTEFFSGNFLKKFKESRQENGLEQKRRRYVAATGLGRIDKSKHTIG